MVKVGSVKSNPFRLVESLAIGPVWMVGGAVRDAWMGRRTADVDWAVQGDPHLLATKFARATKGSLFALDAERGTYRVSFHSLDPFLRHGKDDEGGKSPSGGVKTNFDFCRLQGRDIESDLWKRDLTVNAMALPMSAVGAPDWKRRVIDPTGGREDIRARRIRRVSDANLKEDPLRLLRVYRFSAELGFSIDSSTSKAVRTLRTKLRRIAPERVRAELLSLLATPRAAELLTCMDRDGLLAVVFPEVEPMRRTGRDYYGRGGVLTHSLAAVRSFDRLCEELPRQFPRFHKPLREYLEHPVGQHPRKAHLKLVELFHDVGKPATARKEKGQWHFYGHDAVGGEMVARLAARLKFSTHETRSLARQVGAHMRPGNLGHQPVLTDRAIFRFYRDLQEDAVGLLLVALADHFTYLSARARGARKDPVYKTVRRLLENYFFKPDVVAPPKIVDGTVLMKRLKMNPGPEVGRLLGAIKEAQAAGEVKTQSEALSLAKSLIS